MARIAGGGCTACATNAAEEEDRTTRAANGIGLGKRSELVNVGSPSAFLVNVANPSEYPVAPGKPSALLFDTPSVPVGIVLGKPGDLLVDPNEQGRRPEVRVGQVQQSSHIDAELRQRPAER